jgi:hypothetical protein
MVPRWAHDRKRRGLPGTRRPPVGRPARDALLRHSAPPRAERYALGRHLRQRVPRSALGNWAARPDRLDVTQTVVRSHEGRTASLVSARLGSARCRAAATSGCRETNWGRKSGRGPRTGRQGRWEPSWPQNRPALSGRSGRHASPRPRRRRPDGQCALGTAGTVTAPVATKLAPDTTKAAPRIRERPGHRGGAEGTRTPDPHTARPS